MIQELETVTRINKFREQHKYACSRIILREVEDEKDNYDRSSGKRLQFIVWVLLSKFCQDFKESNVRGYFGEICSRWVGIREQY